MKIKLALYQPDIPQNTGAIIRLAACLGLTVDIIEPCGFVFDDRKLRRSGMDYLENAQIVRHPSWAIFHEKQRADDRRIVLLTTKASTRLDHFTFTPRDILLFGRESAGVPDDVAERADQRVIIPMVPGMRSLNVALTAAMVTTEALRQTQAFPQGDSQ